jgi:predicted nuclease of predicted toxin-antitoxin system
LCSLADESCDFSVVRALRTAGHDVVAVFEISPRVEDARVLGLASQQQRIVITEDKDFGQLVFAFGKSTRGVIFLRYPASVRLKIAKEVVNLVKRRGETLTGCFTVVQPGRIRIGQTPGR